MEGNILLDHKVAQIEGNIVCDVDGEMAMLSVQNGKYYNLGDIGGDIWLHIENQISVRELIHRLVSEFDIEESQCETKVISFLNQLHEEKLIEIV